MVKLVRRVGSDRKVRYSAVHVFQRRPIPCRLVFAVLGTVIFLEAFALGFRAYVVNRKTPPRTVAQTQLAIFEPVSSPPAPIAGPIPMAPVPMPPVNEPPKANVPLEPVLPQARVPEVWNPDAEPPPDLPEHDSEFLLVRFRRRDIASADELAKRLLPVPEIGFDVGTTERQFRIGKNQRNSFPHSPPEPLMKNELLAGLPIRMGLDCHLGKESAQNLQALSRKLRVYLSDSVAKDGSDPRPDVTALRLKMLGGSDGMRGEWKQAEAIPTLMQMLPAEEKPVRLLLLDLLAGQKGRDATIALAQLALFDLSGEAREVAVQALKTRPRDDYRDVLIKGLRYPWPAVADHAAEALVALDDRDDLGRLVDLLDYPDPSAPYLGMKSHNMVVQEVVRVNHLKNCVMCHAPSYDQTDAVRGLVPDPDKPLPPSFSPQYYVANTGRFVRADITYLKQDFSVPQQVEKPGVWPAYQRFDYFVRTRPATPQEIHATRAKKAHSSYPQRESVLFALRELTGRDAGEKAEDWRSLVAKMRRRMESE